MVPRSGGTRRLTPPASGLVAVKQLNILLSPDCDFVAAERRPPVQPVMNAERNQRNRQKKREAKQREIQGLPDPEPEPEQRYPCMLQLQRFPSVCIDTRFGIEQNLRYLPSAFAEYRRPEDNYTDRLIFRDPDTIGNERSVRCWLTGTDRRRTYRTPNVPVHVGFHCAAFRDPDPMRFPIRPILQPPRPDDE